MRITITGTPLRDRLDGRPGQPDDIFGLGGDDILIGLGAGAGEIDRLFGGFGNDQLTSGISGGSVLDGGPGNDRLIAGAPGLETVVGGAGNDTLLGDAGVEYLTGDDYDIFGAPPSLSTGNDVIDAGGGDDVVSGGPGDDILSPGEAGPNGDTVFGGDGDDVLALKGRPGEYRIDPGTGALQSILPLGSVGAGVRALVNDVEFIAYGVTALELADGAVPLTMASFISLFDGLATASGVGRPHFSISDTVRGVVGDTIQAISLADLLANDFDPDGDVLTFEVLNTQAGAGIASTLLITDPASIAGEGYDPADFPQGLLLVFLDAPFTAPLRFTYFTQMQAGGFSELGSTATVTIALPPAATDDLVFMPVGGTLVLSYDALLANDIDVAITGISVVDDGGGIVSFADDPVARTVTIEHLGISPVNVAFAYEAEDAGGNLFNANVAVRVGGSPIQDDEVFGSFGNEQFIPYSVLLANDGPGAAFGSLVLTNAFLTGPGTITDDPARGGIVITSPQYLPNFAFFQYTLAGSSITAGVNVRLENGVPVAAPLARVVSPGSSFFLPYAEIAGHPGHLDWDLDAVAIGRVLRSTGSGASYTLTDTGIELQFDAGYSGGFSLDYTLVDVPFGGESLPSTISFLTAAPPPPVAVTDSFTWGIGDGRSLFEGSLPGYGVVWSRELLANDVAMPGTVRIWDAPFDPTPFDNSQLVRVLERGIPGVFGVTDRLDNGFGLEFRPGISGDTLVYTIVDPLGRTAQGTINFTISVPQPTLSNNVITLAPGATSITINAADILANDSFTGTGAIAEVNGFGVSNIVDSGVDIGGGRTRIDSFTITFDPARALSSYEVRVFTFDTAADGGSANGTQIISFARAAPLAVANDTVRWTFGNFGLLPVAVPLANDSGVGTLDIISPTTSPTGFVLTALGRPFGAQSNDPDPDAEFLTYSAPAGVGATPSPITDSVTYRVRDAAGQEASGTITIIIDNRAPVAPDFSLAANPGDLLTVADLIGRSSDPDGDGLRVTSFASFGDATAQAIFDPITNEVTGWRLDRGTLAPGALAFQYFVQDDSGAFGAGDRGDIFIAAPGPLPTVALTAASAGSVPEGNSALASLNPPLEFTILRSGDLGQPATVTFVLDADGGSTLTADDIGMVAAGGNGLGSGFGPFTANFAPGEDSKIIFVFPTGDRVVEPDEAVRLTLTGGSGVTLSTAGPLSSVGTISNDDIYPEVSLVAPAVLSVAEGDPGFGGSIPITIRRTGDLSYATEVTLALTGQGTLAIDDIASIIVGGIPVASGLGSFAVTFTPGAAEQTVIIVAAGDRLPEPDENFTLTLTGATLGTLSTTEPLSVTGTISNDDAPPPLISLAAAAVNNAEGTGPAAAGALDGVFTHTLLRSGDTSLETTVRVAIAAGTAAASDIAAVEGAVREGGGSDPFGTWLVTFAAGEGTKALTIRSTRDNVYERDEDFTVTLLDGTGYERDTGQITAATSIIRNDEALPRLAVTASSTNGFNEGGGTPIDIFLMVDFFTPTDVPMIVNWRIVGVDNGPSGRSASPDDLFNGFESGSSTIFFLPSVPPTFQLFVVDDGDPEGTEDFGVLIESVTDGVFTVVPGGSVLQQNPIVLPIFDNETRPPRPPVAQDVNFGSVEEDSTIVFSLLLSDWANDPDGDITSFEIRAATGVDYSFDPVTTQLIFSLLPDFNGTASIEWLVADSGDRTDTGLVTLNVTPVNDTPTDIALTNARVAENQPVGTLIGLLSASDVDAGDTFSFAFAPGGNPGGALRIAGNQLLTDSVLDFEVTPALPITLRVTDSAGATFDKAFTIGLINLPDAITGGPPVLPPVTGVPGRGYELIRGGAGPDSILGLDGNDRIEGGGGDDWLDGGEGNDALVGGSGTNWLFGGAGNDSFGGESVAGIQNMDGGPGIDRLVVISMGDTVTVDLVAGTITGGLADNSTLRNIEIVDGRFAPAALVALGDGNANVLLGGVRADTLRGGGGNDVINGGGGADVLEGGPGNDRFELRRGETDGDVILDFDGRGPAWGDMLIFQGFGPGASLSNVGDIWTISYGAGLSESFQLVGVTQLFPGDVVLG